VLPSAFGYGVGTLIFENYAAQYPTRMCPYQCFTCSLATGHAHDSGPVWVADPSPYGSSIRTSTPVYPGAHPDISSIITSTMIISSNSPFEGAGCPIMWTAFYFTPCPVPSCPAYEPNSNDGEYSQPFRHIQYNRIANLRPIATLAMLLCRRIARCT
jgi:hypothetical protein